MYVLFMLKLEKIMFVSLWRFKFFFYYHYLRITANNPSQQFDHSPWICLWNSLCLCTLLALNQVVTSSTGASTNLAIFFIHSTSGLGSWWKTDSKKCKSTPLNLKSPTNFSNSSLDSKDSFSKTSSSSTSGSSRVGGSNISFSFLERSLFRSNLGCDGIFG